MSTFEHFENIWVRLIHLSNAFYVPGSVLGSEADTKIRKVSPSLQGFTV